MVAFLATAVCLAGEVALIVRGISAIRHLLALLLFGYLLAWAWYGLLSSVTHAELVKRFSLMTCSLALCLIIVEGAALLGLVDYRDVWGSFERNNSLSLPGRHADRELLWQHDPYYRYEEPYQGNLGAALCRPPDPLQTIAVRYDRHGFRNRSDLQQADIVVIGDSYIEGYMTSEEKLATTLLSQLQGKTVANLGHSGYGPQQELVVLTRYGLPLHPQTVIWAFFEGNDFNDAERYEEKVARGGNPLWRNLWSRSLTRNVLARILRPAKTCIPNTKIEQYQAQFMDQLHLATPVLFAPSEREPFSESRLNKALFSIAEAAKLCREQNIQFIVAFVPEKYRVYRDLPNVTWSSKAVGSWTVSSVPTEMARRLEQLQLDIHFVDLTPALRAASRMGLTTYLPDDTHWTDAGNRVVAAKLDEVLASLTLQARRP